MIERAIYWGIVGLLALTLSTPAWAAPPANQQGQPQIDALYQEWKKGLEVNFEKFTEERLKDLTLDPKNIQSLQVELDKIFGEFPKEGSQQFSNPLPSTFGNLQPKISDLPDPKKLFNINSSNEVSNATRRLQRSLPDFSAMTTSSVASKQPVPPIPDDSFFEAFKKRLPQWDLQISSPNSSNPLSAENLFHNLGVKIPAEHLASLGIDVSLPPNLVGNAWKQNFEKRIEELKAGMPPMPAPKDIPPLKLDDDFDKYFKFVERMLDNAETKMQKIEDFLNQPLDTSSLKEFLDRPVISKESFDNFFKRFGTWDTKNSSTFSSPDVFYYGP